MTERHPRDATEDPMIRFDRASKRYRDGTVAVHDLSLAVHKGELVVLVGPSGCGKTTTMKMVNRLVEPSGGHILVDGRDIMTVDPVELRRGMGYVIQNVGLFPTGPSRRTSRRLPSWSVGRPSVAGNGPASCSSWLGSIPPCTGPRYPHQLSGGQRQRVGVARALAVDPPVLLMDEPFSAVDPVVRAQLQDEFLRLQDEVHKTILFVTHDIEEAVRLGDRIAVMAQGGHLEQYDTPAAILGAPATPFVAGFVGADRGLKRLSVTPVTEADLEHPPLVRLDDPLPTAQAAMGDSRWAVVLDADGGLAGWLSSDVDDRSGLVRDHARRMDAWVSLGDSLRLAFGEMLQWNAGWIAVLDRGDRFLGVLTPSTLHTALRRSVEAEAKRVDPQAVELESVLDA